MIFCDIIFYVLTAIYFEVWLSLVERCVRDAEAVGSSPVTSTSNAHNEKNSISNAGNGIFVCIQSLYGTWK